MANYIEPYQKPGTILNVFPTYHRSAMKRALFFPQLQIKKWWYTEFKEQRRLRKKLQKVIYSNHIFTSITLTNEGEYYNQRKLLYVISKKMTKLSFTTSDFKSMPVSEAYSPGGPATGAVPFHQHGLILLFPRWEGFF